MIYSLISKSSEVCHVRHADLTDIVPFTLSIWFSYPFKMRVGLIAKCNDSSSLAVVVGAVDVGAVVDCAVVVGAVVDCAVVVGAVVVGAVAVGGCPLVWDAAWCVLNYSQHLYIRFLSNMTGLSGILSYQL